MHERQRVLFSVWDGTVVVVVNGLVCVECKRTYLLTVSGSAVIVKLLLWWQKSTMLESV